MYKRKQKIKGYKKLSVNFSYYQILTWTHRCYLDSFRYRNIHKLPFAYLFSTVLLAVIHHPHSMEVEKRSPGRDRGYTQMWQRHLLPWMTTHSHIKSQGALTFNSRSTSLSYCMMKQVTLVTLTVHDWNCSAWQRKRLIISPSLDTFL